MREITYRQAVNEALIEEMERDPNVEKREQLRRLLFPQAFADSPA